MRDKLQNALDEAVKSVSGVAEESEAEAKEAEKSVSADSEKDVQHGKNNQDLGKHETSKSEDEEKAKKDVQHGKNSQDLGKHETSKSEDSDNDSSDDSEDEEKAKKDVQHGKNTKDLGTHETAKSETKKDEDDSEDIEESKDSKEKSDKDVQHGKNTKDLSTHETAKSITASDVHDIVEKSIAEMIKPEEKVAEKSYATVDDLVTVIKSLPEMISASVQKSIEAISKSNEAEKDMSGTQDQTQGADLSGKKAKKGNVDNKKPEGETGDSGNSSDKVNPNADIDESCDSKAKKSVKNSNAETVEDNAEDEKPVIGKSVQGIEPEDKDTVEKSVKEDVVPDEYSDLTAFDWGNTVLLKSADGKAYAHRNLVASREFDKSIEHIQNMAQKSIDTDDMDLAKKSMNELYKLDKDSPAKGHFNL